MRRFELLQATLVAQVAIVLLVAAVELQQLVVGLADRAGDRIGQCFEQRSAQVAAVGLDAFEGDPFGGLSVTTPGFKACALPRPEFGYRVTYSAKATARGLACAPIAKSPIGSWK